MDEVNGCDERFLSSKKTIIVAFNIEGIEKEISL